MTSVEFRVGTAEELAKSVAQATPEEYFATPAHKNGIQVRIDNDVFEFAVMLALNPENVFSWDETSEELGISVERCRGIFRQLVKHGIAEYVAPGQYRASVALRRMVAMHGPRGDAS